MEVSVDNDASDSATVIEVRAPDRIGTLYRITKALAELELDVRLAKVASLGHEVVDAFYVVDQDRRQADRRRAPAGDPAERPSPSTDLTSRFAGRPTGLPVTDR